MNINFNFNAPITACARAFADDSVNTMKVVDVNILFDKKYERYYANFKFVDDEGIPYEARGMHIVSLARESENPFFALQQHILTAFLQLGHEVIFNPESLEDLLEQLKARLNEYVVGQKLTIAHYSSVNYNNVDQFDIEQKPKVYHNNFSFNPNIIEHVNNGEKFIIKGDEYAWEVYNK